MKKLVCLLVLVLAGCGFDRYNGSAMRLTPLGLPVHGAQLYDVYILAEADAKPGDSGREAMRLKWLDYAMTSRGYQYELLESRVVPIKNPGLMASKVCEYHYTVKVKTE